MGRSRQGARVIQEVVERTDTHLHGFHRSRERFGIPNPEVDGERVVDARTVTVKDLDLSVQDRLEYEYDFGDGWEHVLTVEQVLEVGEQQTPACIKGARSCPPKDCGGAWRYENLLEILKVPEHGESVWQSDQA